MGKNRHSTKLRHRMKHLHYTEHHHHHHHHHQRRIPPFGVERHLFVAATFTTNWRQSNCPSGALGSGYKCATVRVSVAAATIKNWTQILTSCYCSCPFAFRSSFVFIDFCSGFCVVPSFFFFNFFLLARSLVGLLAFVCFTFCSDFCCCCCCCQFLLQTMMCTTTTNTLPTCDGKVFSDWPVFWNEATHHSQHFCCSLLGAPAYSQEISRSSS